VLAVDRNKVMTSDMAVEFARHFERKHMLATVPALTTSGTDVQPELWEQSELPAGEFADEVSGF